jgi:Domain of unknown function (DUF4160)
MATVFNKDGFSVRIYFNDHLPSHVHVFKAEGEAKINLGSETERPTFLGVWNMSNRTYARTTYFRHCDARKQS